MKNRCNAKLKKRFETKLSEECLNDLNFLRAVYKVNHLNEVIEILVYNATKIEKEEQLKKYLEKKGE